MHSFNNHLCSSSFWRLCRTATLVLPLSAFPVFIVKEDPPIIDDLSAKLKSLSLEPLTESRFEDVSNPNILIAVRDTLRSMRYPTSRETPDALNKFCLTFPMYFSMYFEHCYTYLSCNGVINYSDANYLVALILIVKFIKRSPPTAFNAKTIHKLFFIALFIAVTIVEDHKLRSKLTSNAIKWAAKFDWEKSYREFKKLL